MTPEQIKLVQNTWKMVVPISKQAADLFYGRLFELDPVLKALFKHDMAEQKIMLMQMIGIAVNGLERIPEILPAVQALGARHNGYGVKRKDYATVGAALLWTLEQGLGAAFTPDVKQAWTETYQLLAGTMQESQAA